LCNSRKTTHYDDDPLKPMTREKWMYILVEQPNRNSPIYCYVSLFFLLAAARWAAEGYSAENG